MPREKKFGPAPLPSDRLRLAVVKVFFNQDELAVIDAHRGHYPRPAFLRAAGLGIQLKAAPLPAAIRTWADSARIQSCLTQINQHSNILNSISLEFGSESAAIELLNRSNEVLAEFKEFRLILAELSGMSEQQG